MAAAQVYQPNQPMPIPSPDQIKQGLMAWNSQTPLANQADALYQGMQQLQQQLPKVDPTVLLTLAMRETRGGMDLTHPTRQLGGTYEGVNNIYNVKDVTQPGKFINYPDFQTAIMGGHN